MRQSTRRHHHGTLLFAVAASFRRAVPFTLGTAPSFLESRTTPGCRNAGYRWLGPACRTFDTCPASRVRRTVLHASEEVEEFNFDMDVGAMVDLEELISAAKQNGNVPGSNLLYEFGDGVWLLMQVAYDRRIRLFGSSSTTELSRIASTLPDDALCVFTGALSAKSAKRLLGVKPALHAVVARDLDGAAALNDALVAEKERLAARPLTRVSRSRERFLSGGGGSGESGGGGNGGGGKAGPASQLSDTIGLFVAVAAAAADSGGGCGGADGSVGSCGGAAAAAALARAIGERCPALELRGLWGSDDADGSYAALQAVLADDALAATRAQRRTPAPRLVLPFLGEESAAWQKTLVAAAGGSTVGGGGAIVWRFAFEPEEDDGASSFFGDMEIEEGEEEDGSGDGRLWED
ncbi:unnamed protein product [Phaeothamnion confervicola]